MAEQIGEYIIRRVIEDTLGCQYVVYVDEIEKEFNTVISEVDIDEILEEVQCRDEVLDALFLDNGFDVIVGTDYIPNYEEVM